MFLPMAQEHKDLLLKFAELAKQHGIMLSGPKSQVGQAQIEFLEMKLHNGFFQPGPHLAEDLLNFPDENLTEM